MGQLTLADSINRALAYALASYPHLLVFGEDVGRKGGVYGVTCGLTRRFGACRVFERCSMSSRSSDLGSVPESRDCFRCRRSSTSPTYTTPRTSYAARRPACSSSPPGVRVAGLAYQKGFGGQFHNDNAVAVLRDIPGLVVAVPARGDDVAAMLRTCLAAADIDGSVCVFLEPIVLYHTRDLYEPGDEGWLCPYAAPERWADAHVPIGRGRTYGDGSDLTLVTFGNGSDVTAGGEAAG